MKIKNRSSKFIIFYSRSELSKPIYMNKYLFLFFTYVLFTAAPARTQPLSSAEIDNVVQNAMSAMPVAGVAVGVTKDNQIVHLKGYGLTSVNSGENVDENTLFAIASNSKAFTTATLAILVDEGKLSWQDKVVDYIPEFKMYSPYVTENFNIQDLLTHRSGMGLGAGDLMFFPAGSDFTVADVVTSFQYQEPVSAFRTKYDYDNLLYVVAGEIVARASGMSWADFVETKIMKPLGMSRSRAVFQRIENKENVAYPHIMENDKLKEIETYVKNDASIAAAGGLYSSVADLVKWHLMHLNEGKYGPDFRNRLISKKNHDEMWKPHTNISFSVKPDNIYNTHFTAYGLGWNISDKAGYIVLEHTGSVPGMLSRTILIPELKVSIVVLTNTDPGAGSYWSVAQEIMDGYLGIENQNWVKQRAQTLKENMASGDTFTEEVWEKVRTADDSKIMKSDFTGTYSDPWFGKVHIELKNGDLWFRSERSPALSGKMYYYNASTFAIKWDTEDGAAYEAFASFVLDENGKATAINMKGISPNIDFSYDFHDLRLKKTGM